MFSYELHKKRERETKAAEQQKRYKAQVDARREETNAVCRARLMERRLIEHVSLENERAYQLRLRMRKSKSVRRIKESPSVSGSLYTPPTQLYPTLKVTQRQNRILKPAVSFSSDPVTPPAFAGGVEQSLQLAVPQALLRSPISSFPATPVDSPPPVRAGTPQFKGGTKPTPLNQLPITPLAVRKEFISPGAGARPTRLKLLADAGTSALGATEAQQQQQQQQQQHHMQASASTSQLLADHKFPSRPHMSPRRQMLAAAGGTSLRRLPEHGEQEPQQDGTFTVGTRARPKAPEGHAHRPERTGPPPPHMLSARTSGNDSIGSGVGGQTHRSTGTWRNGYGSSLRRMTTSTRTAGAPTDTPLAASQQLLPTVAKQAGDRIVPEGREWRKAARSLARHVHRELVKQGIGSDSDSTALQTSEGSSHASTTRAPASGTQQGGRRHVERHLKAHALTTQFWYHLPVLLQTQYSTKEVRRKQRDDMETTLASQFGVSVPKRATKAVVAPSVTAPSDHVSRILQRAQQGPNAVGVHRSLKTTTRSSASGSSYDVAHDALHSHMLSWARQDAERLQQQQQQQQQTRQLRAGGKR